MMVERNSDRDASFYILGANSTRGETFFKIGASLKEE